MEQLTVDIDEARALNVHRDQQQAESLEKITKELEEQTALADAAEEDLAEVNEKTKFKLYVKNLAFIITIIFLKLGNII